jgi:hypothetical protein
MFFRKNENKSFDSRCITMKIKVVLKDVKIGENGVKA